MSLLLNTRFLARTLSHPVHTARKSINSYTQSQYASHTLSPHAISLKPNLSSHNHPSRDIAKQPPLRREERPISRHNLRLLSHVPRDVALRHHANNLRARDAMCTAGHP